MAIGIISETELRKLAKEFVEKYKLYIYRPEHGSSWQVKEFHDIVKELEDIGFLINIEDSNAGTQIDKHVLKNSITGSPVLLAGWGEIAIGGLDFARLIKEELKNAQIHEKVTIYHEVG